MSFHNQTICDDAGGGCPFEAGNFRGVCPILNRAIYIHFQYAVSCVGFAQRHIREMRFVGVFRFRAKYALRLAGNIFGFRFLNGKPENTRKG